MMKKWKTASVVSAAFMIVFGASSAFAQYGSGACGPTCDVPIASAPTCDVPTCEPTCSLPTGVSCGEAYGCDAGFCGNDCYGGSCFDLCGFLNGTLNVAISPFRWIACELTDGIYPDCGCAPRPEKTKCDPCTICGDYVGGCNDNCEGLPCGGCNDCYGQGTVVSQQSQSGYYGSTPAGVYSSAVYDVEQYDASPTRGGAQVPTLPINRNSRNDFSSMNRSRTFGTSSMLGFNMNPANVRAVSYEQNALAAQNRVANANLEQVRQSAVRPNANMQRQTSSRQLQNLQNKNNVRIVTETPNVQSEPNSNGKTFGKTRPIKGTVL